MTDKILFDKIAESIKKDHPSFSIKFKDESKFMKLLGLLALPFNDRFNEGYTTTIGTTVYFPSRSGLEKDYRDYARGLAHEGVHIFDDEKHGFWFKLSYALFEVAFLPLLAVFAVLGSWIPVAAILGGLVLSYLVLALVKSKIVFFGLAGLAVLSYLGLSVWLSGWWTVLAVGAFVPLLPMSSPWRARWEFRGYSMGIAISYWKYGSVPDRYIENRISTFTGPYYYYMDRNAARVKRKLHEIRLSAMDGSLLVGPEARPFVRTLDVYRELKLTSASLASA